jgi:hypothetical protein
MCSAGPIRNTLQTMATVELNVEEIKHYCYKPVKYLKSIRIHKKQGTAKISVQDSSSQFDLVQ